MHFTKMQGLGNDYVYLDCTRDVPPDLPALAKAISDRHFGVGSDGLICVCVSDKADFRMRMFNADGSESEMCGNGIRCVGKFVYDKGLANKTELLIETLAGIKHLSLQVDGGEVTGITVDMGVPRPEAARTVTYQSREYRGIPVSMGNPHFVLPVNDVKGFDLSILAPLSVPNPAFLDGTNVEIVEIAAPDCIRMRVWERGSGETLACGTGACAALVAAALEGKAARTATVQLPGGELQIRWDERDNHVYMTGPAVTVFEGDWPYTP